MAAKSKWRGHEIKSYDGVNWHYSDTGVLVELDTNRICGHCCLPNRDDGCDPCIGKLTGVENACCGHGLPGEAYIQFQGGMIVRGFVKDA